MSDPNTTGGVSATLKLPPTEQYGNDGAWIVFHGSVERVREDVLTALGLEVDADVPLADVVANAAVQFKATAVAARSGARTIGKATGTVKKDDGPPWSEDKPADSPATETPAEPEGDPLLGEIERAESIKDLQNIFADNKAAIVGDVLAAWKAKGKALKAA